MGFGAMVPKNFIRGWSEFYAGEAEHAYGPLESARGMLEFEAQQRPGDTDAVLSVALAYAAMGWKDAAKAEAARSKEKLGRLSDGGSLRPSW